MEKVKGLETGWKAQALSGSRSRTLGNAAWNAGVYRGNAAAEQGKRRLIFRRFAGLLAAMKLIDTAHPFYRPLWRRIAVFGVCLAWFLAEVLLGGDSFFMPIAGALAVYTAWVLLIRFEPPAT